MVALTLLAQREERDTARVARVVTNGGELDPVTITYQRADLGEFLAVIMPMRL